MCGVDALAGTPKSRLSGRSVTLERLDISRSGGDGLVAATWKSPFRTDSRYMSSRTVHSTVRRVLFDNSRWSTG
jgi:hypothetical protein